MPHLFLCTYLYNDCRLSRLTFLYVPSG